MKFALNCNCKCWDCSRKDCNMIQLFYLEDATFYSIITNSLNSYAGMLITAGHSKEYADNYVKTRAVSLKLAREQYLAKYSKS